MDALTGAPWLSAMARVFETAGAPLYIVGGAVRNPLLGLPLSDVDVCGPTRPQDVCALCQGTPVRAHLRAAHFGTVELHYTDHTGRHMAEYTTFRQDSYRCGHRPEAVRFTTDIAVDALRRDFSVNALYRRVYPDHLGPVIDPTGGLDHLRTGVLHTVTPDPDRVLGDDGLRILRAARFEAEMDLEPTPALRQSLARNAHLLRDIARERLRDEWQKVMMADLRYPALRRRRPATHSGLATIAACGAWQHMACGLPFDDAAARALAACPAPLPQRMALLLHATPPQQVQDTMRTLTFSQKDAHDAARIVTAMHTPLAPFDAVQLGVDAVQAAIQNLLALGDRPRAHALRDLLDALRGKPLSLRDLAINGNDLKPIFAARNIPLRHMGQHLHHLWRLVIEQDLPNTPSALTAGDDPLHPTRG